MRQIDLVENSPTIRARNVGITLKLDKNPISVYDLNWFCILNVLTSAMTNGDKELVEILQYAVRKMTTDHYGESALRLGLVKQETE